MTKRHDDTEKKIAKVAAKARDRAHKTVSHLWWWLLLRGIALIVLAICALVWPQKTLGLLVKILGVYLMIDGFWATVTYALAKQKDHGLLASAAGLLVGAVLLFWTGVGARVFMTIVGIWALLQGLGLYFSVRKEADVDPESRQWVKYVAIALAIAGLILIVWPSSGLVTVAWLLSAVAFLLGAAMVFVSSKLRGVANRLERTVDAGISE